MNTYPLKSISLEEAKQKQFQLIDEITKEFQGKEFLSAGDFGVVPGLNKPVYAQKVERVIANFFQAEKALLLIGSGTGAIRSGLQVMASPNEEILVHTSPIYPTTESSFISMGLVPVRANFNDIEDIKHVLNEHKNIRTALVQYTRQAIDDSYDMEEVIRAIKSVREIQIITDDNYAVMKVHKIGVELGADLSAFSCFKLLGPEGVGVVVGECN